MKHTYDAEKNLWTRSGFDGIAYSDGADFEEALLAALRKSDDKSVFSAELRGKISDWRTEYHLTPARHCLLRPLTFAPGEKVLELGCGCGAITRYFGELGLQVTAVEGGPPRAAIAAERCRDLPNVRVMLDDLVEFQSDELFDWVTLIGVLEYSPLFAPGEDPVLAYLEQALRYLKPGGKLVVAIENQLGLKYFNGCGEDHVGTPFFGPNGLYGGKSAVTFGRNGLENKLRQAGGQSVAFYYPFPDYKVPTAIVSDRAFHTAGFHIADLLLRTEARDYGGRRLRLFSEQLVSQTLENNDLLQHFANSFLVVASTTPQQLHDESTPLAWCYSLNRQPRYRTETTFHLTTDGIKVDKHSVGPVGAVPEDSTAEISHHLGIAPYISGRLLAWPVLKAKLLPGKLQPDLEKGLASAFLFFAQELIGRSHPAPGTDPGLMESWQTSGKHIDFTPFNLVGNKEGVFPIDEEWSVAGDIPVGWILLRAIVQTMATGTGKAELEDISIHQLFVALAGLLELKVTQENIESWLGLESMFLSMATGRSFDRQATDTSLQSLISTRHIDLDNLAGQSTTKNKEASLDKQYLVWLSLRRHIQDTDGQILAQRMYDEWTSRPSFHLLLRLRAGQNKLLADTLESLNQQLYENWRIDIVTETPCPEGLEDSNCVGWHVIAKIEEAKPTLDFLVASSKRDWIVELPPGAALDPLCLWRITHEINTRPDCIAFYTDDDELGSNKYRKNPRFKPDFNLEWMRSADLIGPCFTQREAWRNAKGASVFIDSPWYDQLLRLLETTGAQSIGHVTDQLLSYAGGFPSDRASCMAALTWHLQRTGEKAEIIPTRNNAWRLSYPITSGATVTIAIPTRDKLEFLVPCVDNILSRTEYQNYEILIIDNGSTDQDLIEWLERLPARAAKPVRVIRDVRPFNFAALCNLAAAQANSEYLLLLNDDTKILQEQWLDELMRFACRADVGAVSPQLATPPDGLIDNAGFVLGMTPVVGAPYRYSAKFSDPSYLNMLQTPRDVSALSAACLLLRRSDYLDAGGMDEIALGSHYADIDLCRKLVKSGKRLIYCPSSTMVHYGEIQRHPQKIDPIAHSRQTIIRAEASENLLSRWFDDFRQEPYWNPHLCLNADAVRIETRAMPTWQAFPTRLPRIFARAVNNAQGTYRVIAPLLALRRAGLALDGMQMQDSTETHELLPVELARLETDTIIAQNYLSDWRLSELKRWRTDLQRCLVIFAIDDLADEMPGKSVFRHNIPADARTRMRLALEHCDRLVVSTDFLAETYRHFIDDIRVVPNRLESDLWLPLKSLRQTTKKPRIGWAGGGAHQGDLELLKPVIEATRDEADWIFFGMCPEVIRPLIAEFHEPVEYSKYPAKLASLNLDISVAPLEQIRFNQAKSNLRLLEYGALGLPVLCTDIDPYRNSPACKLPNDSRAWIDALRERIHDPDAAEREGKMMRQWVLKHFILEDHLPEWLAAHLR
jgi:GT2 family glycosyltransferase/SAM-dependent methyltransferase/glycosyltransferase involved in cell wall biosynthesis